MTLHGAGRRAAALAVTITVAGCSSGAGRPVVPQTRPPALGASPSGPPSRHTGEFDGPWGTPVLSDDFGGTRLDPRKWQVYDAPNATSHPGIAAGTRVSGGHLVLVGGLYNGKDESAGVVSQLAQTYGRWEVRLRADPGSGYSATAFLWPTRLGDPEWAEIDFAEIMDSTRRTGGLFIHHGQDDQQLMKVARVDFTKWHTVAVDWLPDHITFWVDGKRAWTYRGPFVPQRADMHLYLRNEVKDGFHRTASSPQKVTMDVDWIRVYRAPAGMR
jgi:hypothetical protein